jgi:2-iminobutanoate/2-iminopropanoate deaminase
MAKKLIKTALAPEAVGPYSQAVIHRNIIYISAQNGALPATSKLPESFESQIKNTMYNLKAVVESAGSRLDRIVKTIVYLTDMEKFHEMNSVYGKFFRDEQSLPARDVVAVSSLPKGALVAVSAIAYARDDT